MHPSLRVCLLTLSWFLAYFVGMNQNMVADFFHPTEINTKTKNAPNSMTKAPQAQFVTKKTSGEANQIKTQFELQEEDPSVCLFGRIWTTSIANFTSPYAHAQLVFLRDVALRSFFTAYRCDNFAPQIKVHQILVPITGWEPHFETWDDVLDFFNHGQSLYSCKETKLEAVFHDSAHEDAKHLVEESDCEWILTTRLDADDPLVPGYWNFLLNNVLRDIVVRTTIPKTKKRWVAALVASRYLPGVMWVQNRCEAVKSRLKAATGFSSGTSLGQTRIYRRDVFEALGGHLDGKKHHMELQTLRGEVATSFLNLKDYESPLPVEYNPKIDARDEAVTRVKMVETTLAGFGPAGAYMRTSLSGSFPWHQKTLKAMPPCNEVAWQNATAAFPPNSFDFLYNSGALETVNEVSIEDTCLSNKFFLKINQGKWGEAKTCNEIDKIWRKRFPKTKTN